jgi:polysaccharide pyruvyl transferase WcaK-like protein
MIAALATATPLLVVGWGHKYREVLEDFSLTDWCLDWQSCREARLAERFDSLRRSADEIRLRIQRALPWVTERAGRNFDLVMQATSQAVAPHQDPPSGHGR